MESDEQNKQTNKIETDSQVQKTEHITGILKYLQQLISIQCILLYALKIIFLKGDP